MRTHRAGRAWRYREGESSGANLGRTRVGIQAKVDNTRLGDSGERPRLIALAEARIEAVQFDDYGGVDVLQVREAPRP
jgi:hypothetical protein